MEMILFVTYLSKCWVLYFLCPVSPLFLAYCLILIYS